jgi:hypothetical protein
VVGANVDGDEVGILVVGGVGAAVDGATVGLPGTVTVGTPVGESVVGVAVRSHSNPPESNLMKQWRPSLGPLTKSEV